MPDRIAFRMTLHPGQAAEYEKRHDEIFPELVTLLKDAGISDYSIWLDPESHHLFGILTRSDDHKLATPARPRGDEALVGLHVRYHGQPPGQLARAGAAEAGVLPA